MTNRETERMHELAEKARDGDRGAFSEIVRIMMSKLLAHTYRMTGDRDAAIDLAQETMVTAWEQRDSWRGEAGFGSWLYRIATNKTLNYLDSSRRHQELNQQAPTSSTISDAPDRAVEREELRRRVLGFMATLPPAQRTVFDLRFYRQLSFDEIARVTERAVGTVKTSYREAVKKLRALALAEGWNA